MNQTYSILPTGNVAELQKQQQKALDSSGALRKVESIQSNPLTGSWLDQDGKEIETVEIEVSPSDQWIEYIGDEGEYNNVTVEPFAVLKSRPPDGSQTLRIREGDRDVVDFPLTMMRTFVSPRDWNLTRIGPIDAPYILPVFSERFLDKDQFLEKVEQLLGWLLLQDPFNRAAISVNIAIDAYFLSSDENIGNFETPDPRNESDRLFYGDLAIAKANLSEILGREAVENKASVILINSGHRGGAGGTDYARIAWASIADNSQNPFDQWQNTVLHEIGHSFNLADEYAYGFEQNREVAYSRQPNITDNARAGSAPWENDITVDPELAPSHPLPLIDQTSAPIGTVGTFAGAFYRANWYRPAVYCKMRSAHDGFCKICADHIATQLQ